MTEKICKDCKFCKKHIGEAYHKCHAPSQYELDTVTGKKVYAPTLSYCDSQRRESTNYRCGPEARWFVQKEPSKLNNVLKFMLLWTAVMAAYVLAAIVSANIVNHLVFTVN